MRPFRRLSAALAVLVILLLANLSWIQVLDADTIRQRQGNTRLLLEQYNKLRGPILVEAAPIASSSRAAGDNIYQRSYTEGPLYAAVTGYYSLLYGASGIERVENGVLSGADPRLFVDRVQQLFAGRRQSGGAVSLTLDAAAQRAGFAGMAGRRGAVVAIDAQTGAVLVLVSTPPFDPQLLAPNDPSRVRVEYQRLTADQAKPLLNRALERLYTPGAPFELLTAAAALASGGFTTESVLPAPARYMVPGTNQLVANEDGRPCTPARRLTLARALAESCATAMAWLGNAVGTNAIANTAQQMGFNTSISLPLPTAPSTVPTTATAAMGGTHVRTTALQLALLAATVANAGTTMRPYLVRDVRGPDLSVLERTTPSPLGTPMSTAAAGALARIMRTAASAGTCPACAVGDRVVHALTSTTGATDAPAVVIGYSGRVAVAVVVEHGNSADDDLLAAAKAAMAVLEAVRQAP